VLFYQQARYHWHAKTIADRKIRQQKNRTRQALFAPRAPASAAEARYRPLAQAPATR